MLKSLMLASAALIAAPAVAQDATTPAAPQSTSSPTSPTSMPTDTAQTGAAQAVAPIEPQPGAAADPVAATVAAEWATYDADGSGSLSRSEFTKWMVALRAKAPNSSRWPISAPGPMPLSPRPMPTAAKA
ncbi:calcium-binding protein [Sphingomonas changnyeongensis]|uniref:Calcium-binding protein n=1 Tax=Sphingomonas changnyeongensis TaxID=2698679 RepID=A0A7Z2S6A5_9SPHN|nr:calcium-binding protein [Sphingomonas changnyeongensis]QHL91288.1 calcium-binding protein [Sphingomonas changnyeongensis]